jgi:hypothetical protein
MAAFAGYEFHPHATGSILTQKRFSPSAGRSAADSVAKDDLRVSRTAQSCEHFTLPSRYAVLRLLISVYANLSSQRKVLCNFRLRSENDCV